jgi:hypothetical protein
MEGNTEEILSEIASNIGTLDLEKKGHFSLKNFGSKLVRLNFGNS